MAVQHLKTNEKHDWVCVVYEIEWDYNADKTFHEDFQKDFPLTKNLSDWLCDLTARNIDDNGMVEREWYILHKTPGHIFVFLSLFSDDLSYRIHYPFTEPENWETRPLKSAKWTETWVPYYDELVIQRQEIEAQQLFSETRIRTY